MKTVCAQDSLALVDVIAQFIYDLSYPVQSLSIPLHSRSRGSVNFIYSLAEEAVDQLTDLEAVIDFVYSKLYPNISRIEPIFCSSNFRIDRCTDIAVEILRSIDHFLEDSPTMQEANIWTNFLEELDVDHSEFHA